MKAMAELYNKEQPKIKMAGTTSVCLKIKNCAKQGCVISPYLLNTLATMAVREGLPACEGVVLAGRKITNLTFV